jgi:hypothetical protein
MGGGSAFPFPYSELKVYKVKPEDMRPTYVETRGVTLDIAMLTDEPGRRNEIRRRSSVKVSRTAGVVSKDWL